MCFHFSLFTFLLLFPFILFLFSYILFRFSCPFFLFSLKFSYIFYVTVAFISAPHILCYSLPSILSLRCFLKIFSMLSFFNYFLFLCYPNSSLSLSSCSTSWAKVTGYAFPDSFVILSIPFVFHVDSWPSLKCPFLHSLDF